MGSQNNNEITQAGWAGGNKGFDKEQSDMVKKASESASAYLEESHNSTKSERQKKKLEKIKERFREMNIALPERKVSRPTIYDEIQAEAVVHLSEFLEALSMYNTFEITPEIARKLKPISDQVLKIRTKYYKEHGEKENQIDIFAEGNIKEPNN